MSAKVTKILAKVRKKPSKRDLFFIIASGVIILGIIGWLIWSGVQSSNKTDIDTKKFQAVFLNNGQVYFGRLTVLRADYFKLTDIFYLQKSGSNDSANPQQPTTDTGDVQLIKLGSEVHGPQDEMVITKDQVLFYENLKSDSSVSKTIQKYNDAQ